jgi:hypothetical protein
MSPTKIAPAKAANTKTRSQQARVKEYDRVLSRIADSLDVAQKDLGKLSGDLGAGAADLRRNLARLLRDARRDAAKLSRAARKDLDRLQKDMLAAAKAKPKRAAAGKPKAASASKTRTGAKVASKARPGAKGASKARSRKAGAGRKR